MISPDSAKYSILRDSQYGGEEFFSLVYPVKDEEMNRFLRDLVELVTEGYLEVRRGGDVVGISLVDLHEYVRARRAAGENLREPPEVVREYIFHTTEKGRMILQPQDRGLRTDEDSRSA